MINRYLVKRKKDYVHAARIYKGVNTNTADFKKYRAAKFKGYRMVKAVSKSKAMQSILPKNMKIIGKSEKVKKSRK